MKEVKNKEEFKEKDEIETYFSDAKKKSFPTGIIFLILFLICISGGIYYYFVIDNPQNIFKTIFNNGINRLEINSNNKQMSIDFSIDTDITTNNKEYLDIVNILTQISIKGTEMVDYNEKKAYGKIDTFYQGKDLLSMELLYEDNNAYLKLYEIFDKVIKFQFDEEEKKDMDASFEHEKDSINIISKKLTDNIEYLLENAKYSKEYTKIEEKPVKKITLLINKELMEEFFDTLINDQEFIQNYSLLFDMTEDETIKSLKELKNKLTKHDEKISLYLTILKNEFLMLENIFGEKRVTIVKEEEQYLYKMYSNSIIEYQGYVTIKKDNNNYQISFSIEDIEEEINIEINFDFSIEYNKTIESMDITNSIDYENMTEEDINKITDNLLKNKAILSLTTDMMLLYDEDISDYPYLQTT